MAFSFSSSVALRDRRKTFVCTVESGETAEPKITVLPRVPFRRSMKAPHHEQFCAGQRVVLLSLTADGWIDSGFKGQILSLETKQDSMGRAVPRAQVVWDESSCHPSRIGYTALSRLRHEQ